MNFLHFWKSEKDRIIPSLLFLGSVTLASLGLYEASSFCMYLFPVPLYFLLRRLKGWETVVYGLNYGLYLAFPTYLWLTKFERFDPFIMAEIGYGMAFLISFAVATYLMRRYPKKEFLQIFGFALVWLILQIVMHYVEVLGFAKAFIKISNTPTFFDWVLPYLGTGGVEALVLGFGFLLARSIEIYLEGKSLKKLFWYFVVFAVLIVFGIFQVFTTPQRRADKTIRVAAVQGNYGIDWYARVEQADSILDFFLKSTREVADKGAKIVIWPEYAAAVDILTERPDMSKKIEQISKELDVVIVMGTLEKADPTDQTDKGIGYDLTLVYDPDKGRLEPYRAVYPYSSNIYHGTKTMVYRTKYGNFPVLSCFEVARHRFVADYFNKGEPIDFIVAIANNQVFDGTYGANRLKNHARRVAGENGRFLMYVTNTAPTTIYDNEGDIVAAVPYQTQGYVMYDIEKRDNVTLYSRFQDLIPLIVSAGILGYAFFGVKVA